MLKIIKLNTFILVMLILFVNVCFAKDTLTNERVNEVLYTAKIVDNLDNLDKPITRSELAKIVVKASPEKDTVLNFEKTATEKGYMIRNIYGDFRGNDEATYNDLIRASLALLGYTDKDFTGNKVVARATKFVELELTKNIEKYNTMPISKQDVLNGIYNTLKEKTKDGGQLFESIFDDMTIDEDGELNVLDMIEKRIEGPYLLRRDRENNFDFLEKEPTYYINGRKFTYNDIKDDIDNYGYVACYYDTYRNIVYAYSERDDIALTVACKRGYIYDIIYNANDFVVPKFVDIDIYRYKIASDEMIFAFSYAGNMKKDDEIIIIYNKVNDIVKYEDEMTKYEDIKESGRIVNGSIITAFKVE